MIIKDAVQATEQARRIIGNPTRFLPQEGKRLSDGSWRVKAIVGILDDIHVTVEMPENILDVDKLSH